MFKNNIPKLYRNKFFETALWAFVTGMMYTGSIKREVDAVREFVRYFKMSEDDVPLQTLLISFHRRKKEFRAMMRQDQECIYFPEHESIVEIYEGMKMKLAFDELEEDKKEAICKLLKLEYVDPNKFFAHKR